MKRTIVAVLLLGASMAASAAQTLLNVSYDATRELYEQINPLFEAWWKSQTGQTVTIQMSHGGSAAQAQAVIAGLPADVVTLGVASDIDALHAQGNLLPANWQSLLPDQSAPYTSTVVFLVRAGNPKNIRDWPDLIRPGVSVITPNPKTSAAARWSFLAAYAFALDQAHGDSGRARAFMKSLYQHVPILPTASRAATTAFTDQQLGDVLLSWEDEAYLAIAAGGPGRYQIIVPSVSMLALPPVAVVQANARRHHTEKLAEAYLRFLYTPQAQQVIAQNHYRPVDAQVLARYANQFPRVKRVDISAFGGWEKAQREFFGDGGLFDQLY